MFTISKVAEIAGVSAHTLRYYEKIGLLPPPDRNNGGIRLYTEQEVHFITFLNSLKKTGMSLDEIAEFVKDGCILEKIDADIDVSPSLQRRIEILNKHLANMELQRRELDAIINLTKQKLSVYETLLTEKQDSEKSFGTKRDRTGERGEQE